MLVARPIKPAFFQFTFFFSVVYVFIRYSGIKYTNWLDEYITVVRIGIVSTQCRGGGLKESRLLNS